MKGMFPLSDCVSVVLIGFLPENKGDYDSPIFDIIDRVYEDVHARLTQSYQKEIDKMLNETNQGESPR